MYRIVSMLCLVCVLACVGCASPPPPPTVLQPVEDTNKAKEVTRIEFAVFGKFKDKLKSAGGRRGGDDCADGQCERPEPVRELQPQPEPGINPLYLAATLGPLGIAVCIGLGVGAFLVTKNARDT